MLSLQDEEMEEEDDVNSDVEYVMEDEIEDLSDMEVSEI